MQVTVVQASVPSAPRAPDPARAARLVRRGRWLSSLVASLVAVAAGVALLLAFPPYGLWWLAPIGVALLAVAVHGRRVRAGLGLGALCGLALFVPLLAWTNLNTGRTPWLLLGGVQASYVALLGGAAALAGPVLRRWPGAGAPVTGALWVAQEALRDRAPFGGFPWGRLAFSQADSPLLRFAAWGGAPLVTFAVALCGGMIATAIATAVASPVTTAVASPVTTAVGTPAATAVGTHAARAREVTARRLARVAALSVAVFGVVGVASVATLGWLIPVAHPGGPTVTVAIIQGNVPRLGLEFNAQRRAVLDNHVRATEALAARVAAGQVRQPDLVVWPENASDIDPLTNADAAAAIDAAAAQIRAPILLGAVLEGSGAGPLNAGLVWVAGRGVTERYIKRHPVPFAEYIPLRPLARMVSDQVDRVAADFQPGDRPGVLRVGPVTVGDVICFEVAYDDIVRDTVTGGAQLIAVQTNNATFNQAEAAQQLAMVRLRAVEHGRPALMASTVGISSFVDTAGRVSGATRFDVAAVVTRTIRLGGGRTLATRMGVGPEYVLVAVALAALIGGGWLRRREHATTIKE